MLAANAEESPGARGVQEAGPRRTAEEGDTGQDAGQGGTAPPEAGMPPQPHTVPWLVEASHCPLVCHGLAKPRPNRDMKMSDRVNGNAWSCKWAFWIRSIES